VNATPKGTRSAATSPRRRVTLGAWSWPREKDEAPSPY